MRIPFSILFFLILCLQGYSQWSTFENGPKIINGFRFDDVYFTDRLHGSVVSHEGFIYTTFDGGESWLTSPRFNVYLRAIEYITPQIGFAGSLNHNFYMTSDGGVTWEDITERLPGEETIVCGLGHYGDRHVYAVGNYGGPAILFKSDDAGDTWSKIVLDSILFGVIDVYFINPMEGYICGSGPDTGALAYEGRILHTSDGGESWKILMQTGEPYTYIWKMDFLEDGRIFGAVETFMGERPAIIRSLNGGVDWELIDLPHDPEFPFDGQGIGFLNDSLGWFAGYGMGIFETRDGGNTWARKPETANINRFFKVSDSFMLGAGFELYFYEAGSVSTVEWPIQEKAGIPHEITNLSPNPATSELLVQFNLDWGTSVLMDICGIDGTMTQHVFKQNLPAGNHSHSIDIQSLPSGTYFLVLRTHERHLNKQFIKLD